jgi:hypothetical protein
MPSDIRIKRAIGVYREHDGTVYSMDAYWKYGNPETQKQSNGRVAPSDRRGPRTVSLVTGMCI